MAGKKRLISAEIVICYRRASKRMFGDFQAERLSVAVGEGAGRDLAMESDVKKIAQDIVAELNNCGFGTVRAEKPTTVVAHYDTLSNFVVKDSAEAVSSEKSDKPLCQIIRGFIRGAYTQVYHQENISVKETKCSAMGEKECVFEAYWVPM